MPADTARRAAKLLAACDPFGEVRVDADDSHLWWRTGTVEVRSAVEAVEFPNLEPIRETFHNDADIHFTIDRPALATAIATAAPLAATTRQDVIRVESAEQPNTIAVTVRNDSGEHLIREPVPLTGRSGPDFTLMFASGLIRDAVAFLRADTIKVAATIGRLGVSLESEDRHTLVMQRLAT